MVFPVKVVEKKEEEEVQVVQPNGQKVSPYHHHPLIFDMNEKEEYLAGWNCNQCGIGGQPYQAQRWICKECDFDCCGPCFEGGQQELNGQKVSAQHNHPLNFDVSEKEHYQDGWKCDVCKQGGRPNSQKRWVCKDCDFDCCETCIDVV